MAVGLSPVAAAERPTISAAAVPAVAPATAPGLSAARETTGTAGTLTSVIAAPDGTIFGGDDRGVFKLTSDGWVLIRPIDKVTPSGAGKDPVLLQFSGWSGALTILPGAGTSDYVIVAADGAGADIIRSSDGGITWSTVKTLPTASSYDNGAVTGLCWSPVDHADTLYALVQKTQSDSNPAYAISSNRGATWTFNPDGMWPESCDMGRGSLYAAADPLNPDRVVVGGGTGLTLYDGDTEITEEVPACVDDPAGFARGAISGTKVLLVTEDGCFARAVYDPQSQTFGAWTEGQMSGVGSVGIFSQGYYETPTTMTMYADTAWLASQAGVFAYSWSTGSKGTWSNAGRGIPLRDSVAVPTYRNGDRVIMGGYQGAITVLGLFSSTDAGATFRRMTRVPASVEPRGLAMTDDGRLYLSDYDVMLEAFSLWSSDGGATWSKASDEVQPGEPIAMAAFGDRVYVVVNSAGSLSLMLSVTGGATFTSVDDTACGWSAGGVGTPSVSIAPDGGFVALFTGRSGASALRGCTMAAASTTAQAIITTATSTVGVISLIDYLDGQLRAYLGPNGATNAGSLVSSDGRTWAMCTSAASALAKQPAYITSIARDADRSLIGTVVNPLSGTRLIRSTDGGCTWTWPEDVGVDDEDLDMSSMVLPEGGEAEFADLEDSIDAIPGRAEMGFQGRAGVKVTSAVRPLRIIGPSSKGSVPLQVRFGPAPAAPKKGAATVGKGSVTLRFSAPASGGGGLVGYTATCSARGKATRTATGTANATSITVRSLVAKTSYTCVVAARDAAGPGPAITWTGLKPT